MKKILIPFFLLFAFFCRADEVHLKTGAVVNGTIVDETDTSYFIRNESGTLEVIKENVNVVKKDVDFSVPEETTKAQPVVVQNNASPSVNYRDFKNDPNYFAYRHYFFIGLGFLIPGLVLTVSPLLATPSVVNSMLQYNTEENYDFYEGRSYIYWTSFYFSCIGVGVLLDLISIPMFCLANKYYQKVLDKYRIGLDVRDDNLEISMNVAF